MLGKGKNANWERGLECELLQGEGNGHTDLTFGAELENRPSTIAISHSADFFELKILFQCTRGFENGRAALFLGMSGRPAREIEAFALLRVHEDFLGDDFTIVASSELKSQRSRM